MALSRHKEIGILAVLVAASTVVHGQINGPDFYRSPSGRVRSAQEAAAARAAYNHQQQQDARFEEFRRRARETRGSGSPMTRDSSKIVEALLKPTQAEVSSNDVLRGGATAGISIQCRQLRPN